MKKVDDGGEKKKEKKEKVDHLNSDQLERRMLVPKVDGNTQKPIVNTFPDSVGHFGAL